jgi:hypothetical protein
MSIRLGTTNPSAFRLGNTAVSKLMLGNTEVWSAVDADAADYFARIVSAGSSISSANQAAVNAFIVGCKADGIWSAIKASCLLCAADDLTGALVPLVGAAPTNNNFVSGDYNRITGLLGNGSTKYLDSNRANNADPQNNFSMGFWQTQACTVGSILMGAGGGNNGASLITTGNLRCRNITPLVAVSSINNGYGGISRSSSIGYSARLNGSTFDFTQASQTPLTNNIQIFRTPLANLSGNPRLAFYHIGEALNLSLLDARLATLMAALT